MDGRGSLIALLTDFGTRDPYVAAMKGVIVSRTEARLLDLSHHVSPFDVFEAAVFLAAVVPYLPQMHGERRSIVVAVVDPGVGSERRIIAASDDARWFLAPDNGLLSLVLGPDAVVHDVTNEAMFLPGGSRTFHGRDRFAPVAAAMANGCDMPSLGRSIARGSMVTIGYEPPVYGDDLCRGTVIAVDHYGNLITDLAANRFANEAWEIRIGDHVIDAVVDSYRDGAGHEAFMIVGSRGTIELSVSNGSAAERLRAGRHSRVEALRRGTR